VGRALSLVWLSHSWTIELADIAAVFFVFVFFFAHVTQLSLSASWGPSFLFLQLASFLFERQTHTTFYMYVCTYTSYIYIIYIRIYVYTRIKIAFADSVAAKVAFYAAACIGERLPLDNCGTFAFSLWVCHKYSFMINAWVQLRLQLQRKRTALVSAAQLNLATEQIINKCIRLI